MKVVPRYVLDCLAVYHGDKLFHVATTQPESIPSASIPRRLVYSLQVFCGEPLACHDMLT